MAWTRRPQLLFLAVAKGLEANSSNEHKWMWRWAQMAPHTSWDLILSFFLTTADPIEMIAEVQRQCSSWWRGGSPVNSIVFVLSQKYWHTRETTGQHGCMGSTENKVSVLELHIPTDDNIFLPGSTFCLDFPASVEHWCCYMLRREEMSTRGRQLIKSCFHAQCQVPSPKSHTKPSSLIKDFGTQ